MTQSQDFFDQLDELIRNTSTDPQNTTAADVITQWGCPSVSIAILEEGKITSRCISSIGHDSDTLFQACSISKPAAGLALMKIIEKGLLSLDDKICDRLPDNITKHLLSDPATAPVVRTITLKHLMSHTSGMSQGGFPGYPDHSNVPSASDVILGSPLVNTMPIKMISLPGLEWMYSGGGCTLFQLMMEQATGKPFNDIMTEYVLKPLDMTRSYYNPLPTDEKNLASVYYNGTVPTEYPWHILPEQAAAGLWTTPSDLLKLVRATQSSLDPDSSPTSTSTSEPQSKSTPFTSPTSAKQMLTLVKHYMGLTWFTTDTQFGHSGGNHPGYRCYLYGYASLPWNTDNLLDAEQKGLLNAGPKNCGISVMTNSALGLQSGLKIMHAIAYLKGWPQLHEMGGVIGITTPWEARVGKAVKCEVDEGWKGWMGVKWSEDWELVVGEDGGPAMKLFGSEGVVHKLVPAAMPGKKYEGGKKSVELVLEGLRLMLRLAWDGEERVVEVWNDGKESRTVLREKK